MKLEFWILLALVVGSVQATDQRKPCWIPDFQDIYPEQRCTLSLDPDTCSKPYAVGFDSPGVLSNYTSAKLAAVKCCKHPLFSAGVRLKAPAIWTSSWGEFRNTQGTAQCACAVGATCSDICNTWDPMTSGGCPCFAIDWDAKACKQISSLSCRKQGVDVYRLDKKGISRCCTRLAKSGAWKSQVDITGLCATDAKCTKINGQYKCLG